MNAETIQNNDKEKWEFSRHALARVKPRHNEYADIRITLERTDTVYVENGEPLDIQTKFDSGFGVRVLSNGAWGYAASAEISRSESRRVASQARKVAEASGLISRQPVKLAAAEIIKNQYITPLKIDPFEMSYQERMDPLRKATKAATRVKNVSNASGQLSFKRIITWFTASNGSQIRQEITICGGGISISAGKGHRGVSRSFPSSHGGYYGTGGFELIQAADFENGVVVAAEEAVALLTAPSCPTGQFDIILSSDQLSMQIHESVGHPLELDRVFGAEANFSGTSFATPDQLGKLHFASSKVTLVTDPTIPGGLATYGYDDDGVKSQRRVLIRDGILVGYLSGRETAKRIGAASSANNRAAGWRHFPINRMSNTILVPGKWDLDDLLADTEKGLFLITNKSWSIDDRRENFRFSCEAAYEIRGGRLGRLYRAPSYNGLTTDFWNRCDAVCNEKHFEMWGTMNCGKGEPSQSIHTGQGASPARFRGVNVEPEIGKRPHGQG